MEITRAIINICCCLFKTVVYNNRLLGLYKLHLNGFVELVEE